MTSAPAHKDAYYPRPPQGPPAINPWLIRLPVLFVTGGILLVLVLAIFVAAFQLRYAGKITPGVYALGINLSGMDRGEAVTALSGRFVYDNEAVFTFRHGDRLWQMTARDLGMGFDAEATVEQAFASSRAGGFAGDLVDQTLTWLNGKSIAPIIHYDQNVAVARLLEIAQTVNRDVVNATLTIEGANVISTPGQTGRALDINATLAQLDAAMMTLTSGAEVPLVVHETPPQIWNVDEAANRVRAALSSPLELVAEGPTGVLMGPWTASVEQIAALLEVQVVNNGDGTYSYQVDIDFSAFEDFLNELAPGLLLPPRDGRFHFDTNTRQLVLIQPSVSGRSLNVQQTLARLADAVFRYDRRSVPIAFDYTEPTYHDRVTAAELGITELVAEATTYYPGSPPNRIHNITEGASRFDGIIIGPGQEFSFNYWLGEMSEEAGFVQSLVIQGERTVDGIGGGICQVSTTAFRAAFAGGFRIIERNSHAYRVGYYELNGSPPGLDAAIWTPDRDMRFQNDTPYHLLIEVGIYPGNSAIQFRLYSTNPGRRVTIEAPVIRNVVEPPATTYQVNRSLQAGQINQVEWAAAGADVNVTRVITDLQGNVISRDNIFTHYLPWGAVFEVAPGDARSSG